MKKLPKKQKKYLKFRQSLQKQKIKRRKHRKIRKKKKRKSVKWWDRTLNAPDTFGLREEKNHSQLQEFIQDIFNNTKPNERLRLDFKNTKQMMVDALLLFIAYLEKALCQHDKFHAIRIAPSDKHSINAVLTQVGVLKLCGQDFHINPEEEKGIIYWRYLSGSSSNKLKPQEIFCFLKKSINQKPPKVLFTAVKEALLNIKHHAYVNDGNWWMLVRKNEETKEYIIVVCDIGMGIPVSLEQGDKEHQAYIQRLYSKLRNIFGLEPQDSTKIRISMKIGKTSTGKMHRGKGLPAMKNVVEQLTGYEPTLKIYSNYGCYTQVSKFKKPKLDEYKNSIDGTVVTWIIPSNVDEMIEA